MLNTQLLLIPRVSVLLLLPSPLLAAVAAAVAGAAVALALPAVAVHGRCYLLYRVTLFLSATAACCCGSYSYLPWCRSTVSRLTCRCRWAVQALVRCCRSWSLLPPLPRYSLSLSCCCLLLLLLLIPTLLPLYRLSIDMPLSLGRSSLSPPSQPACHAWATYKESSNCLSPHRPKASRLLF